MQSLDFVTPEALLTPSPAAPHLVPIDAALCTLQRARAVVSLLMAQCDPQAPQTVSRGTMTHALWDVMGHLEILEKMILMQDDAGIAAAALESAYRSIALGDDHA